MPHFLRFICIFFILLLGNITLIHIISDRSIASVLKEDCITSQNFRQQNFPPDLYQQLICSEKYVSNWSDILTISMLRSNFHPKALFFDATEFLQYKREAYWQLKKYYEAIWSDLQYFPVASDNIYFDDSWMETRTYGGMRQHEGIDLFGQVSLAGYYPVISITDGIVEQKGWLPLGGYRIGIRSTSGAYFYYAHLSSYEKDFSPEEVIHAGDILGFMGNTGYGKEGTSGLFPVHLHLGIYITAPDGKEISINPYQILKCLRKKIRNYSYY